MMEQPSRRRRTSSSLLKTELVLCALNERFGRKKDFVKTLALNIFNFRQISSRMNGVAEAVSASTGTPGSSARISAIRRYGGLKSYPHCEIQCASSTAIRLT